MGKYGEIQEDFYEERTRILEALDRDENRRVIMRLIGALAFRTHCPQFGYIQDAPGRVFTDIDFASYRHFFKDIVPLLTALDYEKDKMVTRLFSDVRLLFPIPNTGGTSTFSSTIWTSRTSSAQMPPGADPLPYPCRAVPGKMQIAQINEKDLIDTIMLLREHSIGMSDDQAINCQVVCGLLANDWGSGAR
jgi:hypothetical protein